jgi:hypothetical protein
VQRDHPENGLTATSVGQSGPARRAAGECHVPHVWMQRCPQVDGKQPDVRGCPEVAVANGKTVDETLKTMNATAAADKARHTDEYQRPSDIGKD